MISIQHILIVILPLLVVGVSLVTTITLHYLLHENDLEVATVPVYQDEG